MPANSVGTYFRVTTFGESHGPALGVVIDGCPAGVHFDEATLINALARRRPGNNELTSARKENDKPEILSGIFENKSLGSPISIIVRNQDARSQDYQAIKDKPRPGHADDVWESKFGHRDHRGGGRASGRETVSRVIAGAIAQMLCTQRYPELKIKGFTSQVGPHAMTPEMLDKAYLLTQQEIDGFALRLPNQELSQAAKELILAAKEEGKSYGGRAHITVNNVPANLGQPVFHKLKSDLAGACMSIGATHSFSLGSGVDVAQAEGTEFHQQNNYSGIRGGISTGEAIDFSVAFKPTASVLDVAKQGRHDPCIVPRAVPVLEAMCWLVLADHILWSANDKI